MPRSLAILLMIFVTLLWSIAGVVTRHLDSAASFEVTFWRSFFTGIPIGIALTILRGRGLWTTLHRQPKATWISGICWSVMFTAFMVAITITTVANVLIVMSLCPLITALFSRLFLAHRLPWTTWLAIAAAGIGIVWMFAGDNASVSLLGTLVALAVPFAYAINFTTMQYVGNTVKPEVGVNGRPDMLQAVLLGAIISVTVTLPFAFPFQATGHDLMLLSMLGVFQLALPCLLLVRLTRELTAPEISLLALLELVFGVTWAWLWAGEHLNANTLTGGFLVLSALVLNELARIVRSKRAVHQLKKEWAR